MPTLNEQVQRFLDSEPFSVNELLSLPLTTVLEHFHLWLEAPRQHLEPELYRSADGEHRWRLCASNGRIVGASTEGYKNRADCTRNLYLVTGLKVEA